MRSYSNKAKFWDQFYPDRPIGSRDWDISDLPSWPWGSLRIIHTWQETQPHFPASAPSLRMSRE